MPNESGVPGWKPLTGLDEEGTHSGRLVSALLTTFDPPDPGVLIEDYLPVWLGLENSYADEGSDRLRYFAELEHALRRLKGHIAIVSSAGEVGTSAEAWIWNYIRRFEVGALGAAVQHAKLWMFRRAPVEKSGHETLELIVSSANLTRAGLRRQIQAGWRCVLPLESRGSTVRRKTWGVLLTFLDELGKASGTGGPAMIDGWLALLGRCACPADIEFIASVPGVHSATTLARRSTAWGAAGLGKSLAGHTSPKIAVMAPTIGRWTADVIKAWANVAGVRPDHISVAWLRGGHPWAETWQLDPSSEAALTQNGIRWLEVLSPNDDKWKSPLLEDHKQADTRWCHAKLYELRDRTRCRLLITSANFSRAAWGDARPNGGSKIDNFELGVVVRVGSGFSGRLGNGRYQRATHEIGYEQTREAPIAWLAAEWNGDELTIECRPISGVLLAAHVEVSVARLASHKRVSIAWSRDSVARANVPWLIGKGVPILASVVTADGAIRATAVHDVRTTDDGHILCGEFDEPRLQEMLDRLLEEKYGYLHAPGVSGTVAELEQNQAMNGNIAGADYAVPAYVDARRRFQLIDNWWNELRAAGDRDRSFILNDGKRICERWSESMKSIADRGLHLAARIAVEELALRVRRNT